MNMLINGGGLNCEYAEEILVFLKPPVLHAVGCVPRQILKSKPVYFRDEFLSQVFVKHVHGMVKDIVSL